MKNSLVVRVLFPIVLALGISSCGGGASAPAALSGESSFLGRLSPPNGSGGTGTNLNPGTPPVVNPPPAQPPPPSTPPPALPWRRVSNGCTLTAAVCSDGTLWTWGRNDQGQLGIGLTGGYRTSPGRVGTDSDWIDVAAGTTRILAVKSDGTLWGWGASSWGELPGESRAVPQRIGTDSDWVRCFSGDYQSFAIKQDGTLWAWGRNSDGILGFGKDASGEFFQNVHPIPAQVGTSDQWVEVAVGSENAVGRRSDGTIWIWGSNWFGQCGTGPSRVEIYGGPWTEPVVYLPVRIGLDADWVSVAPSMLLKADGTLWALGSCADPARRLVQIGAEAGWSQVSGALALRQDGTIWKWRTGPDGDLVATGPYRYFQPTDFLVDRAQVGSEAGWAKIWGQPLGVAFYWYCSDMNDAAEKADGSLWTWGDNRKGQLGLGIDPTPPRPVRIPSTVSWKAFSLGYYHALGLAVDGTIWSWGEDYYGGGSSGTPLALSFGAGWKAIAAGEHNSLALQEDGSLWGWGSNRNGQLGTTEAFIPWSSVSPVRIGTGNDWKAVRTSANSCFAIRNDDSLWAWGSNSYGRLGVPGADSTVWAPILVPSPSGWKEICPSGLGAVGLRGDGTLWGWGYNLHAMGIGGPISAPLQLSPDSDWASVSYGDRFTLAIKQDGSLWWWSEPMSMGVPLADPAGALPLPARIGTGNDWVQASARGIHTFSPPMGLARKANGTLWTWDDLPGRESTPRQVGSSSAWTDVQTVGGQYTEVRLGLQSDGTLWGWGDDFNRQLGLGGSYSRDLPSQVTSPVP